MTQADGNTLSFIWIIALFYDDGFHDTFEQAFSTLIYLEGMQFVLLYSRVIFLLTLKEKFQ